jgi:hypothetical protein
MGIIYGEWNVFSKNIMGGKGGEFDGPFFWRLSSEVTLVQ